MAAAELAPPPRRAPGIGPFLRDRKVRGWIAQGALLAGLALLLAFFVRNASDNMVRAGVASGFGFLGANAGIDVNFKLIPYGPESTYARLLLVGILNTLLVSGIGVVLATLLGFTVGIARLSENWLLSALSGAFVEIVRNIPLLLFVFFWYFAILGALPAPRQSIVLLDAFFLNNRGLFLPVPEAASPFLAAVAAAVFGLGAAIAVQRWSARRQAQTGESFPALAVGLVLALGLPLATTVWVALGIGWEKPAMRGFGFRGGTFVTPEFVALLAALSTYTAGFIAEIVRAGILSVSDGQRQAAAALGLRQAAILRLIVIPQALRVIIPPLTSQYLNLIKNSSFAAAIAFPDIVSVFVGSTLNQTGQAIEVIAITLALYLSISVAVSALMNWYNAHVALVTR